MATLPAGTSPLRLEVHSPGSLLGHLQMAIHLRDSRKPLHLCQSSANREGRSMMKTSAANRETRILHEELRASIRLQRQAVWR